MKIAILGYGREGKSVLKFIQKLPRYRGAGIWVLDKKKTPIPSRIKSVFGENYLKSLGDFDLIFRSPGIAYNLPQLIKARDRGVKCSSATRLFFEHCPTKIIGVTGTKGKGTTTTLLYKMMAAAGLPVHIAGNIGIPMIELLPKIKKNDWVILELSSFQLQDLEVSPHIAAVLDIFPDHQDSHLNLKEYYEAKTNIARHQKKGDAIFFFKDHPLSQWTVQKSRGKKIPVDQSKFALFGPTDLKMPGTHNFKNAVMAASIARQVGVPAATIARIAGDFPGNEHRLEFVRQIGNINIYNDSASTNPHTTAAAIRAFPNQPKILIAGGQDKNLDYAPLTQALKNSNTKLIVLFGENKDKIAKTIGKTGVTMKMVSNLKSATALAYAAAKKLPATYYLPSTCIIFSPGAASFDQFNDYADRGNRFKALVKKLRSN